MLPNGADETVRNARWTATRPYPGGPKGAAPVAMTNIYLASYPSKLNMKVTGLSSG